MKWLIPANCGSISATGIKALTTAFHGSDRSKGATKRTDEKRPSATASNGTTTQIEEGIKMKKFGFATLIASGLTAAVLGFAPIASADVTVHQSPGNAQVSATPGGAAHEAAQQQLPFGGDLGALIFHH